MKIGELREALEKSREELYDTQFNVNAGREKDYAQIRYLKKKVAQILTLINRKISKTSNKSTKPVKHKKEKVREQEVKKITKEEGVNKINK